MQPHTLEFIDGQLKVWEHVNGKCDHGTSFYVRDMERPFGKPNLPFDGNCIKACFKSQLLALSNKKPDPDNPITFRATDWDFVASQLQARLFGYLNDGVGCKLEDPTNAFTASSLKFQLEVAEAMAQSLRTMADSDDLLLVENNPEYFSGCVVLIASKPTFYELRLGDYF